MPRVANRKTAKTSSIRRKPSAGKSARPPKTQAATPRQDRFSSEDLSRVVIAIPLAKAMDAIEGKGKLSRTERAQALKDVVVEGDRFSVIVDLNTAFPG